MPYLHGAHAHGAEQAHFLGPDRRTRRQSDITPSQVLTLPANVLAGCDFSGYGDPIALGFGALLHDHSISAIRNFGAGKDTHGSARLQYPRRLTGSHPGRHPQRLPGHGVSGPNRVAIHGTVVRRRHIGGDQNVVRQNAPEGLGERQGFGAFDELRLGQQMLQGVIQGGQLLPVHQHCALSPIFLSSRSRGRWGLRCTSPAKLQGPWRLSSWVLRMPSQPVRQAPVDPGRQKITV